MKEGRCKEQEEEKEEEVVVEEERGRERGERERERREGEKERGERGREERRAGEREGVPPLPGVDETEPQIFAKKRKPTYSFTFSCETISFSVEFAGDNDLQSQAKVEKTAFFERRRGSSHSNSLPRPSLAVQGPSRSSIWARPKTRGNTKVLSGTKSMIGTGKRMPATGTHVRA